jgi:hypothetical protein
MPTACLIHATCGGILMAVHRSLSLRKFIAALNDNNAALLQRYFHRMITEEQISPHLTVIDYTHISIFLETFNDERVREMIYEDFRRINDICEQKASTLVWAGKLFQIPTSPDEALQSLAMRLFLDYPEAFEYAWTRYCVYASPAKVSRHNLPCESLQIDSRKLEVFENEIKKYFSDSAKGEDSYVHLYDEGDQVMLLVERGSYLRALAHWEGREVKVKSIRPASEDVLIYDRKAGQLCIQTPYTADMEQYIRSFARIFIGNAVLADSPDRDRVYVLDAILKNSFNWAGNEYIKSIVPVEAKLKTRGVTEVVLDVRSKDLRQTLEKTLSSSDLSLMEVINMKFRLIIETQGKEEKVTFEIAPPYATDLSKKKHADIISAYLRENGVQLR